MITSTLFHLYRFFKDYLLAPLLMGSPTNSCRYSPTCSLYCKQALQKHGPFKGAYLCLKRISRCHPYSRHPHLDPVP